MDDPAPVKEIGPFHDGLAAVNQKGELNYKYIGHSGATVLGPFDLAWRFSEVLARVNLHGRIAFIDPQGKIQFTLADDVRLAEPFAEGLAKVQFRAEPSGVEKIGYVDHSGKFVIPAIYQAGSSFQNGLAFVSMCGQSGYTGKHGEPVWGIKPRAGPAHSQPAPSSKYSRPNCSRSSHNTPVL